MNLSPTALLTRVGAAPEAFGEAMQRVGASAMVISQTLPGSIAAGMPTVGESIARASSALSPTAASELALIEKPISAAAQGTRVSTLMRISGVLKRTLPLVAIGASAASGAHLVQRRGVGALLNTKRGRGAVLGAVGGGLLLVPTPATQVGAAGVLALVAANELGGLRRSDTSSCQPGTASR